MTPTPKLMSNPVDLIPRHRVEVGSRHVEIIDRLDASNSQTLDVTLEAPADVQVVGYLMRRRITTIEIDPTGLGLPVVQALQAWGVLTLWMRRANGEITIADRLVGVSVH